FNQDLITITLLLMDYLIISGLMVINSDMNMKKLLLIAWYHINQMSKLNLIIKKMKFNNLNNKFNQIMLSNNSNQKLKQLLKHKKLQIILQMKLLKAHQVLMHTYSKSHNVNQVAISTLLIHH